MDLRKGATGASVNDQLAKSSKLQEMKKRRIQWQEKHKGSQYDTASPLAGQPNPTVSAPNAAGALMVHQFSPTVLRAEPPPPTTGAPYPLKNSFILDSGATHHVCNDRSQFITFKPATDDQFITTGEGQSRIKGTGTIWVQTESPGWTDGRRITLSNTYYIPTFSTKRYIP